MGLLYHQNPGTIQAAMKETVAEFTRRTGLPYDPPPASTALGRALAGTEAVPTLFRFPGPCGLLDNFLGTLHRLAAEPGGPLWAADASLNREAPGAAHFGTMALLEPLRFAVVAHPDKGIYVGQNREIHDAGSVVWVPPSALQAPIPWDQVRDGAQARSYFRGLEQEENEVKEALGLYLEELVEVGRVGIPDPGTRWCDRPREDRLRLSAHYGIAARWTGAIQA